METVKRFQKDAIRRIAGFMREFLIVDKVAKRENALMEETPVEKMSSHKGKYLEGFSVDKTAMSFNEWEDLDMEYIKKRSVGLDLKIIFKGFWMVLFDHSGE